MYRIILHKIKTLLEAEKAPIVLILGLRQTGKSTLAMTACGDNPHVRFNFDLLADINEFIHQDRHNLANFAARYKNYLIIIDEVQKSPEAIGVIKHLYDTFQMKFLLTGSSEIKIRRGVGDSLAGRIREIKLFPLSLEEINKQNGLLFNREKEFNNYEYNQQTLLRSLIFGAMPQLQNILPDDYISYLQNLTNSILSKDVLEISGTRKPAQVFHLAKLLALQIGQIVNFNELSAETQLSRATVVNFIDIFEQMGLIIKASPISTNTRESIIKRTKIYFTDLGVRNSLVNDFSSLAERSDGGHLLENAVFAGLKRTLEYGGKSYELGFFRSEYGTEIDIVKKEEGNESLLEVKINLKNMRMKKGINYVSLETAQKYLY